MFAAREIERLRFPFSSTFPLSNKRAVAYKDCLTLSKDADPETPIPKHAKAEFAKLQ
jgi:hypothetical protein